MNILNINTGEVVKDIKIIEPDQIIEVKRINRIEFIIIKTGEIVSTQYLIDNNIHYYRLDHQLAFDEAINNEYLSTDRISTFYAGEYMYMYSRAGKDYFKNKNTRRYDVICTYLNNKKEVKQ